jgi:hypothetical protein
MLIIAARQNRKQPQKSFAKIAESMNNVKWRTRAGKKWTKMWIYKLYNSPKVQNIINYHIKDNTVKAWSDYDNQLYMENKEEYDAAMEYYLEKVHEDRGFKLMSPWGDDYDTFGDEDYEGLAAYITYDDESYWGDRYA